MCSYYKITGYILCVVQNILETILYQIVCTFRAHSYTAAPPLVTTKLYLILFLNTQCYITNAAYLALSDMNIY